MAWPGLGLARNIIRNADDSLKSFFGLARGNAGVYGMDLNHPGARGVQPVRRPVNPFGDYVYGIGAGAGNVNRAGAAPGSVHSIRRPVELDNGDKGYLVMEWQPPAKAGEHGYYKTYTVDAQGRPVNDFGQPKPGLAAKPQLASTGSTTFKQAAAQTNPTKASGVNIVKRGKAW